MTAGIIREAIAKLNVIDLLTSEAIVDDIVNYFNRQEDHSQIREAVKTQYGLSIKLVQDPATSTAPRETYSNEQFNEQVDAGIVETISIGFGNKIIGALATLFSEEGQKFTLVHETVEDLEVADELLLRHRNSGGFEAALTSADKRSVQAGSSAVFIDYHEHLNYQVLSPSDVRVFFADYIEDNGIKRRVDTTDIEDASVVIIRLSQKDLTTWNYLAIMGRSDIHKNGRYVQYTASQESTQVPSIGEDGVIDFEIDGNICNPLSYWANQYPDKRLPEYPIAVLNGGTTDSDDLMPFSTSLWADCVTFDVAASRLLSTSQDAARGTLVIKRLHEGASKSLPRTLHGAIELDVGLEIEHISHDAGASESAMEVLKKLMIEKASGYSVPDYMVSSENYTPDKASGIALEVKTRPLIKARRNRINETEPAIRKIFEVEQSLIGLFDDSDGVELLSECTQNWDAGAIKLPENKKEAADRIISLMDKGILDTIAAIREYYQCPTDAEAIEIYEKMQERASEYPSLAPEPKKTLSLLRGQNGQTKGLQ